MRLTIWLSAICFFVICACERKIPFLEVDTTPVIVVNSFVSPDSLWQVNLSQSSTIDSIVSFSPILNGEVNIKDLTANQIIPLKHQENGNYSTNTCLPQTKHTYQLTASANGFTEVLAESTLPDSFQVQIKQIQASMYQNQANYLFDLTIGDNPNEANFYLFEVQYILETPTQTFSEQARHFSFDQNSENEVIVIDHQRLKRSYLTDEYFNGETYTTRIGAHSTLLEARTDADTLKAIMAIKSISEAGYLYFKSLERFENLDNEIFTEPPGVFSKIENGLGIFAGYSTQRIEIILE